MQPDMKSKERCATALAESRADESVMRVAALVGLLLVLLFAGCASAQPASQLPKKDSIAPELTKQEASPRLDLTSLEKRLNETQAIDVLDKIAFRNQVDDLLSQFRAFYQGNLDTTLAELRRPYDLLVLTVLSLLQDNDPSLAAALVASREAIWGILADPAKFATI